MTKPSEQLIQRLADGCAPGHETITDARNAVLVSYGVSDAFLKAVEEAVDKKPAINDKPKPALPVAFVSNHIEDGVPRSYAKYQLCRTKCGKHFIGTCRGGVWSMKAALDNRADVPIPDWMEVEYWVDLA